MHAHEETEARCYPPPWFSFRVCFYGGWTTWEATGTVPPCASPRPSHRPRELLGGRAQMGTGEHKAPGPASQGTEQAGEGPPSGETGLSSVTSVIQQWLRPRQGLHTHTQACGPVWGRGARRRCLPTYRTDAPAQHLPRRDEAGDVRRCVCEAPASVKSHTPTSSPYLEGRSEQPAWDQSRAHRGPAV